MRLPGEPGQFRRPVSGRSGARQPAPTRASGRVPASPGRPPPSRVAAQPAGQFGHRFADVRVLPGSTELPELLRPFRTPWTPVGTVILFAPGSAEIGEDVLLKRFVKAVWERARDESPGRERGVTVTVHGYASAAEPDREQLPLRRAVAVTQALRANGVTSDIVPYPYRTHDTFGSDPLQNQRAVVTLLDPRQLRGVADIPADPSRGFPGLAARKRALRRAQGNLLDLAIAMMETEGMTAEDTSERGKQYGYPLGDVDEEGKRKTHGAANYGIFKQNWDDIRHSQAMRERFGGRQLAVEDYRLGELLNRDLALDVAVQHENQARAGGLERWFAGHRYGADGLKAYDKAKAGMPLTPTERAYLSSVASYREAVMWILNQLIRDEALQRDDRKVWSIVPRI